MKALLLALAALLACAVYEIDREARITRHPYVGGAIDLASPEARLWADDEAPPAGLAGIAPLPHPGSRSPVAGRVEREHSIRLYGPGVSRKYQTRI